MLITFIVLGLIATFIGGLLPLAQTLLSRPSLRRIFAFRSGILVAVTFLDILPEAWKYHPTLAGTGAMTAFFAFYILQNFTMVDSCTEYLEECNTHILGWVALAGLFTHSFMDGFNLSISFAATAEAGLAVGAAMIMHKLMDGFTLTSLFRQSGYSLARSSLGLMIMAAATPLGCAASSHGLAVLNSATAALLLGAAGGSFLYLSAAEFAPRLHKHPDIPAFASFASGVAVFWGMHLLAH
ncbi:MAG: ZIP family metal transporter [Elusimicrobiota bacterium]|jgi:ZIP family zinc transporter/zinc and cadmium transporter